MKIRILYFIVLLLVASGCNKDYDVLIPVTGDSILEGTMPLNQTSKALMEGVYLVNADGGNFGDTIVLKWNRKSLLLACFNGNYFVLNAGTNDTNIMLEGYWRYAYGDDTGLCQFAIAGSEGGNDIINNIPPKKIIIHGTFGNGESVPGQNIMLTYLRPFSEKVKNKKFNILAHRGGGRTSDKLPVSENSLAIINFTGQIGSTGIEADVRITRDKVAFLYHDSDINIRLTKKGPLAGEIKAYSWQELSNFVRLIHGEKIPTLEEALTFTIDSTSLDFVYLDIKEDKEVMEVVIPIQQKMLKYAKDKGRNVTIVIGIPSETVMEDLLKYSDYQSIPSLCELTVDDVRKLNSMVWAPRWTLGTQNTLVQQIHDEGRSAICWTIDNPLWIRSFINEGQFDGLLTNYPSVVTYYHYMQQ